MRHATPTCTLLFSCSPCCGCCPWLPLAAGRRSRCREVPHAESASSSALLHEAGPSRPCGHPLRPGRRVPLMFNNSSDHARGPTMRPVGRRGDDGGPTFFEFLGTLFEATTRVVVDASTCVSPTPCVVGRCRHGRWGSEIEMARLAVTAAPSLDAPLKRRCGAAASFAPGPLFVPFLRFTRMISVLHMLPTWLQA